LSGILAFAVAGLRFCAGNENAV